MENQGSQGKNHGYETQPTLPQGTKFEDNTYNDQHCKYVELSTNQSRVINYNDPNAYSERRKIGL